MTEKRPHAAPITFESEERTPCTARNWALKEKDMRTIAEHLPFTFASIGVGLYFIDRFGYRWRKVTERNARRGRQYCRIAKFSFAVVYSPGDEFLEGSVLTNIHDARTKQAPKEEVQP